jgi:hypothetical protein
MDSLKPELAFPLVTPNNQVISTGMTRRDYVATRALQGLLSSGKFKFEDYKGAATMCVGMTDALLKELEKSEKV